MILQFDENVKTYLKALAAGAAGLGMIKGGNTILNKYNDNPRQSIEQKIETSERPRTPIKVRPNISQKAQEPVKVRPNISQDISSPQARARHAFYKLMLSGLTRTAAIGIVANLKAEAGEELKSDMVQLRGGPGRGLIQWEKGGRFDTDRINLVSFAKKQGKKWTDFNTQIDFIIHELTVHPEYMRVKQMLNNADSVEDATLIFLKKYEKAGVPHTGKRLRYAKELEQTMDQ